MKVLLSILKLHCFLGFGLRVEPTVQGVTERRPHDLQRHYTYKIGIYFDLTVPDRKPVHECRVTRALQNGLCQPAIPA
jgi:hypothetical protein